MPWPPAPTPEISISGGTTDDSADETDGSVTATVNAASGYTVSSSQGAATVSVADNDDTVQEITTSQDDVAEETDITITVDAASATEGSSLEFQVNLSAASTEKITLNWYTAPAYDILNDRAHFDDYQVATGEMVFAPEVTSQKDEVWLEQDSEEEPDECFAIEVYLPGSFFTPDAVGTMTHRGRRLALRL